MPDHGTNSEPANPPKLTEDLVANALWTWRQKQGHFAASTRCHLFAAEADFMSLTGHYAHDHEIKLSRADYLSEIKQSRGTGRWNSKRWKHIYLSRAYTKAADARVDKTPNYYSFVTPKGMLSRGDPFPHYAGLIEFEWVKRYVWDVDSTALQLRFTVRRKAPRLHDHRLPDATYRRFCRDLAFRFFAARAKLR